MAEVPITVPLFVFMGIMLEVSAVTEKLLVLPAVMPFPQTTLWLP